MFIQTKTKIYEIKFGIKGLILLQEKLNTLTDKREQKFLLLYCGLCHSLPPSFQEIQDIMNECDLSFLSCPRLLSILEIQELYRKAVGEVGIAPSDFYNMTPEEIEWAYEGYLRRKETEANLFKIALLSNDKELIRLTEDKGYEIGNLMEREEVLKLCKKEGVNNEL